MFSIYSKSYKHPYYINSVSHGWSLLTITAKRHSTHNSTSLTKIIFADYPTSLRRLESGGGLVRDEEEDEDYLLILF